MDKKLSKHCYKHLDELSFAFSPLYKEIFIDGNSRKMDIDKIEKEKDSIHIILKDKHLLFFENKLIYKIYKGEEDYSSCFDVKFSVSDNFKEDYLKICECYDAYLSLKTIWELEEKREYMRPCKEIKEQILCEGVRK